MEDSDSKNNLQDKMFGLIDVLSEDDCLLSEPTPNGSSSENLAPFNVESSRSVDDKKMEDGANIVDLGELIAAPLESSEPERVGKHIKYNLRKSLAWDNAFFTNAGVLEPEELCSIIDGVEKDEKTSLPRIEEDIYRSSDSFSTIGGESLESLEAGLFEDIRASIQKSSKVSNAVKSSGDTSGLRLKKTQAVNTLSEDAARGVKMRTKAMSRTESGGTRIVGKSTKQPVPTSRQSTSSLPKVPKAARVGSIPTTLSKRASPSANHVKMEKDNAKSVAAGPSKVARGAVPASKTPALGAAHGGLPKHAPSRSSYKSSITTKVASKSSSSSLDSLASTLSDKNSSSPLKPLRRTVGSRVGNPPFSGATSKAPSRIVSKSRTQSGNQQLTAYLKSVPELSPSISPASSISEWSLDSSSSNVTVNQRSHSTRSSLECKSDTSQVHDSQNNGDDQCMSGYLTQVGSLCQHVEKASTGSGAPSHPPSMKPSGLKLPSTKFGFFEGVKSLRASKGSVQSHSVLPSGLPKVGSVSSSPRSMNKEKLGKLQPAKAVSLNGSSRPSTQLPVTVAKPISPAEKSSNSATKASRASRNVKNCASVSPKVHHIMSSKTTRESHLKAEKVENKGAQITDSDSCSIKKNGSQVVSKEEMRLDIKGNTPVIGELENAILSTTVDENSINTQHDQKNGSDLPRNLEDENAHIGDPAHGLCISVEKVNSDSLSISQGDPPANISCITKTSCPKEQTHDKSKECEDHTLLLTPSETTAASDSFSVEKNSSQPVVRDEVGLDIKGRPESSTESTILVNTTGKTSSDNQLDQKNGCDLPGNENEKVHVGKQVSGLCGPVEDMDINTVIQINVNDYFTAESISCGVGLSNTTDNTSSYSELDNKNFSNFPGNENEKVHVGQRVSSLCNPVEDMDTNTSIQRIVNDDSTGESIFSGVEVSNTIDKTTRDSQLDHKNGFGLPGSENEKVHVGEQVSCLCRLVEDMDANTNIQRKVNDDSTVESTSCGAELSCHGENVCENKEESLDSLLTITPSKTTSETLAGLCSCSVKMNVSPHVSKDGISLDTRDSTYFKEGPNTGEKNLTDNQRDHKNGSPIPSNKDEKVHIQDQVDDLCKLVKQMDISSKIERKVSGHPLSQGNTTAETISCSVEFSCMKNHVVGNKEDSLSTHFLSKTSELMPGSRIPFAVKDSVYNENGSCDINNQIYRCTTKKDRHDTSGEYPERELLKW